MTAQAHPHRHYQTGLLPASQGGDVDVEYGRGLTDGQEVRRRLPDDDTGYNCYDCTLVSAT